MEIIHETSLAQTIDALNDAFFLGIPLSRKERREVALWIVSRHPKPGAYANMFAPTQDDFRHTKRVFTGEKMESKARTSHILGEEACRALILLDVNDRAVQTALNEATDGMSHCLTDAEKRGEPVGTYCCGTCTAALWRHLAVGGLGNGKRRLMAGLRTLQTHRDGGGRWHRYPFYYTILSLTEIDLPLAKEELRYAAPACERSLRRLKRNDRYTRRRRALCGQVLKQVGIERTDFEDLRGR